MRHDSVDTVALVQKIQHGTHQEKHQAFDALVRAYQKMAYYQAYQRLHDRYLAEDVTQEAFLTAYLRIHQLREPQAFASWLKRIVWTQADRLIRRVRPPIESIEQRYDIHSNAPSPEDTLEEIELVERVHHAISALPEHERVVTEGFYLQGESQKEIASRLHIPVTTVKKRLQYARQHLRLLIGELNQAFDQVLADMMAKPKPQPQRQAIYVYQHYEDEG